MTCQMSRHDQLLRHVNSVHHKIVYMNVMAESQWASACLPPSFVIWLLTAIVKHDHIRGTDYLGCYQDDPAQGSIHGHCSHG